jgi:hypothetical protein
MASVVKKPGKRERAARRTPVIEKSITLDVRGVELVARLNTRIRWHRSRAETLGLELKRQVPSKDCAQRQFDDWRREAVSKELTRKCREHEERSVFLAFVRDHPARGAVYRLGGSDLRMLEIMPDAVHWW